MASIKKNPANPDKYFIFENGKKVLGGKSFFKINAKQIAEARTRLEKKKMKKKPVKRTGGIASYTRKIQNAPAVKSAAAKIKKLEMALKTVKKAKAAAVKKARAAHKK